MARRERPFKGRQFTSEVILWAVRWYLQFPISYRDLELMLRDRGVSVDHTTVYRWIQAYAAELEKRLRPHLRPTNGSWRVDETYIKVKGRWTYLYRAVDSRGQTIDFRLSAQRDAPAAKRFFRKALGQSHTGTPRALTVDKNAAYPAAVTAMKRDRELWRFSRLRPVKYLNDIVEQDDRRLKRLVRPGLGFGSLSTARRTLAGYEAMAMIRKGQIRNIGGGDMPAGSVSALASQYRLKWNEANPGSCGLQDGQHGHTPPEVEQSAAIGGNMLVGAGARTEEVAEFVVSATEPGC